MARKKYQDQGMMMQQREHQHQQQQEQEQPEVQKNQERQFNKGGGGGGPPFLAFGATIMSTSMECKPDPQDPTRQICKQVSSTQTFNPKTGQFDESTKSSEYSPENRLSRFGGNDSLGGLFGGNSGGDKNPWRRNNHIQSNWQQPSPVNNNFQQDSPGFVSSLKNGFRSFKNQMSNWWNSSNRNQGSSKGFIQSPSSYSQSGNINFQQNTNNFSRINNQPINRRFDPFEQFEQSLFSGKSQFNDRIFGDFFEDDFFKRNDDDFFNRRRKDYANPIQFYIDQMQKNDPFFDGVKSGDDDLANHTNFVYFKRDGGAEQFSSQDLKKAFDQRQKVGTSQDQNNQNKEPEEYVKNQTQYQSKNNSKIYDV